MIFDKMNKHQFCNHSRHSKFGLQKLQRQEFSHSFVIVSALLRELNFCFCFLKKKSKIQKIYLHIYSAIRKTKRAMYPTTRTVSTMTTNTVVDSSKTLHKFNILTYSTSTQTISVKDMLKTTPSATKLEQTPSKLDGLTTLFTDLNVIEPRVCTRSTSTST